MSTAFPQQRACTALSFGAFCQSLVAEGSADAAHQSQGRLRLSRSQIQEGCPVSQREGSNFASVAQQLELAQFKERVRS